MKYFNLELLQINKMEILNGDALCGLVIEAAEILLRKQFPLVTMQTHFTGMTMSGFEPAPYETVQLHHTGHFHWVVSASLGGVI